MKVGDKFIYKLNSHIPYGEDFEESDDAFYYNKSYEIIKIGKRECFFIDEYGEEDFFYIVNDINYYIFDYFYTPTEVRLKKLNSL